MTFIRDEFNWLSLHIVMAGKGISQMCILWCACVNTTLLSFQCWTSAIIWKPPVMNTLIRITAQKLLQIFYQTQLLIFVVHLSYFWFEMFSYYFFGDEPNSGINEAPLTVLAIDRIMSLHPLFNDRIRNLYENWSRNTICAIIFYKMVGNNFKMSLKTTTFLLSF